MKYTGNITLNALGQSEIRNLVVERVSATPIFVSSEAGRLIYNTTSRSFLMNTGLGWVTLSTGGDAAAIANNLTSLQTEVDAIETSIGLVLNPDGTFNAATLSGSSTLASSTSLTDALFKIDNSVSNEAARAINAESALTQAIANAINAEAVARVTADTANLNAITTSIATEVIDRNTAIATESAARSAAIATEVIDRNTAITAEAALRAAADSTELANRVNADTVNAATAADQLATETGARLAGDAALGGRIDGVQSELNVTQASAGMNVDGTYTAPENTTYLSNALTLKSADVLLDTAITAEVATRLGQVAGLASGLANEAQLRADGDANLQAQLTAYINAAVTSNNNADAAEAARAIAAEAAIKAELDLTQATIGTAPDGSLIPITGTNYLNNVTTVFGGAFVLDTQIKLASDQIAAEGIARATADTAFNVSLQAEVVNRENGDDALQTELNTTQAGAGLETDGSYASPTNSNYLNLATSLKDADFILDARVKVVSDLATSVGLVADAVAEANANETARALAAELILTDSTTTNSNDILAEVSRATSAENAVIADLASEVSRAVAADAALDTRINKGYFLYDGALATTHVVPHNIGTQYCNVTVIDSANNEQVIPQSVTFSSANSLVVTFNIALACKIVVMGLGV